MARPRTAAVVAAGGAATAAALAAAHGTDAAGSFALAVLVEGALSADTVVALLLLFAYFAVPSDGPVTTRVSRPTS
jgi:hypothetical protein